MALRSRSNVDGKVDTENGIFVEMEGVMEVRYMSGDDEITDRMDFFEFQASTKRIPADFCHKDNSTGEQALFFCLVCDCELKSIIPLKSHVEGAKHIRKAMAYKQRTLGCEPEPVNQPKKKRPTSPKQRIDVSKSLRERLEDYDGPIVGLVHITEFADPRDVRAALMYNCKLDGCKSAWGNSDDMFNHVKKEKHIRNFFRSIYPEDTRVNSQTKNDLLKKAVDFCLDENNMAANERPYNEISRSYDSNEYMEIANRPMDWSEKKHKHFADKRGGGADNPNLTPLGYKDRGLFNEAKWKDFKAPTLQEVVDDLTVRVRGEASRIEKMWTDGIEEEIVLMEIDLSLDLIEYDLENHSNSKLIEEGHTSKRKLLAIKERIERGQQVIPSSQPVTSQPVLTSSQQRQLERTTATEAFMNEMKVQVKEIAEKKLKGKAANDIDDIVIKIVEEKIMPNEIKSFTKKEQNWGEFKYTDPIRIRVTMYATDYMNKKYKA